MPTLFRTLGLALLGCAVLIVAACDDGPTKPKPVQKSYPFYFNDQWHQTYIYRYDPIADLLDTLVLPEPVYGRLAVSHDGRLLYVGSTTTTAVIDLASLSLTWLPYSGDRGVATSPDGSLVALAGRTLTVLRTSDHSVVFSDTGSHERPSFSRDGKTLICGAPQWGQMQIVEFGDSITSRTREIIGYVSGTAVRPDGRQWAIHSTMIVGMSYHSFVQLFDAVGDSLVYATESSPGFGNLLYTPDGQTLVYSSPGDRAYSWPGDTLYFLQPQPPYLTEELITSPITDQNDSVHTDFPIKYMAITPDGAYLAGAARPSLGKVIIYRLPAREPVACFEFSVPPRAAAVGDVTCQSAR